MATATHVGPILVSGLGIQGPATTQTALPDTLLLVNNAGTGYITGCGPSPGVNGEILFQTDTSNGANPQRVLALEGNGWGIFYGDLSIAAGELRLGLRSRGGWDSGTANVNSDGASLFLNATSAAGGSIFLNFDQGTGGVRFGDGFGNQVGHIDESGNLTLSGTAEMTGQLNAFGGISTEIIYVGQTPLASGAKLVYIGTNPTGNTAEIQAVTWDATNPIFDQTLQLNPLGGDVEIGEGATIDYAGRGDFTGLFVLGSQVLTAADLPPDAIPYPPAGVPVSTGTAWSPSINPATLARYPASGVAVSTGAAWGTPINPADLPRLSTPNTFTAAQTINGAITVAGGANLNGGVASGIYYLTSITPAATWQADGVTTFIDSGGTGRLLLNYNHNPGGIGFGHDSGGPVVFFDPSGNATFNGTVTASNGFIRMGPRSIAVGSKGSPSITCSDNQSLVINGGSVAGSSFVFFNYDQGEMVNFCDGATNTIASIDKAGNAHFNGTVTAANGHALIDSVGDIYGASLVLNAPAPTQGSDTVSLSYNPATHTATLYAQSLDSTNSARINLVGVIQGSARGVNYLSCRETAGANSARVSISNSLEILDNNLVQKAIIDNTGTATFAGNVTMGSFFQITGPAGTSTTTIFGAGNTTYMDSHGSSPSASSAFLFRTMRGDDSNTVNVLSIDSVGNANFAGTITAAGKSFLIAHPLIEGKDLIHGSLEGPEHGVYYRGEVTTKKGTAEVTLPDYFESLTFKEDRSVMLTQKLHPGDSVLSMLAATPISKGKFIIVSSVPATIVAWEVKAVRRIGVDRLAVVRDRFVHPTKEDA